MGRVGVGAGLWASLAGWRSLWGVLRLELYCLLLRLEIDLNLGFVTRTWAGAGAGAGAGRGWADGGVRGWAGLTGWRRVVGLET